MNKQIQIFHNPRCSKSRQTLALLHERGIEPELCHYLKAGLDADAVVGLCAALRCRPHAILRQKEAAYKAHGLSETSSDEAIIAALIASPILLERPIVVVDGRAAIGRPPQKILGLLE